MIGKDEIAEACRYNDAISEEGRGLDTFFAERGVDVMGLTHVAMQRALRMVMMEKGLDPNRTTLTPVQLTQDEDLRRVTYASVWLDAFAAGLETARKDPQPREGDPEVPDTTSSEYVLRIEPASPSDDEGRADGMKYRAVLTPLGGDPSLAGYGESAAEAAADVIAAYI